MTEVMPSAKFGSKGSVGQSQNYGALSIASGNRAKVKRVLDRIEAVWSFYLVAHSTGGLVARVFLRSAVASGTGCGPRHH
jgi:hypothetical protein